MAKVSLEVVGADRVLARLKKAAYLVDLPRPRAAVVGYRAAYAIHVHEDLTARHAKGKVAKFLETPARQMIGKAAGLVAASVRAGYTVPQALLRVALLIQRESQKLVPVDTGYLKNSAFTEIETTVPHE